MVTHAASRARRSRGVSLVEAIVALAVMGFGMMGVVAMQVSMRLSSDVAKQRSEATRLAQEEMERLRTYTLVAAAPGSGRLSWAEILSQPEADITPVAGTGRNTTFKRAVTVTDLGAGQTKMVNVAVRWKDRTDQWQSVQLTSTMTLVRPDLAATLGMAPPGDARNQAPFGRHAAIPPAAIDQGDGTSQFTPPGSSGYWVFNNTTGMIEQVCVAPGNCTTAYYQLVSGFVRFALGSDQPEPSDAEQPPSSAVTLAIEVVATFPSTSTTPCFEELSARFVAYYCAVPVTPLTGSKWSGRVNVYGGFTIAGSLSDDNSSRRRICRYTPVRGCHPAVESIVWGSPGATASCTGASPTPSRKMTNAEHPLDYTLVGEPLTKQNFLVIRAGDGDDPFDCPADDPGSTRTNTNTWHHQPHS